jgi:hypothetical protein
MEIARADKRAEGKGRQKGAGTYRRAVRDLAIAGIPGEWHMECAYCFGVFAGELFLRGVLMTSHHRAKRRLCCRIALWGICKGRLAPFDGLLGCLLGCLFGRRLFCRFLGGRLCRYRLGRLLHGLSRRLGGRRFGCGGSSLLATKRCRPARCVLLIGSNSCNGHGTYLKPNRMN